MLIREVLIGGHYQEETCSFSSREQLPVLQVSPTHLICGNHLVTAQISAKSMRHIIKQHLQACKSLCLVPANARTSRIKL